MYHKISANWQKLAQNEGIVLDEADEITINQLNDKAVRIDELEYELEQEQKSFYSKLARKYEFKGRNFEMTISTDSKGKFRLFLEKKDEPK